MRFLLISDTHGKLGIINELAHHVRADAVIHAGDFGFYDDGSYGRLSARELRLQVVHSDLSRSDKEGILDLSPDERIVAARESLPLSEFPAYIEGHRNFSVPVYAVWGNHEDKDVVERLFRGDIQVKNLHSLHHRRIYKVGPVLVYGLGGNFLAGSKLLQRPIAGGAGKIWSTLAQYCDLVETIDKEADWPGLRIFVSHVSPGKEPFMELVGVRTRADFTISGHMGTPTCMVWNPFTVSSLEEAEKRLRSGLDAVRNACTGNTGPEAEWVEQAFSVLARIPEDTVDIGGGIKAPRWYRGMTHVNLPDAHVGYAVMDIDEAGTKLQTFVQ
jgi:predicted phosphodiesterase